MSQASCFSFPAVGSPRSHQLLACSSGSKNNPGSSPIKQIWGKGKVDGEIDLGRDRVHPEAGQN